MGKPRLRVVGDIAFEHGPRHESKHLLTTGENGIALCAGGGAEGVQHPVVGIHVDHAFTASLCIHK